MANGQKGITEELSAVMELAVKKNPSPRRMLEVVESLLVKSTDNAQDPAIQRAAIDGALSIVRTVAKLLDGTVPSLGSMSRAAPSRFSRRGPVHMTKPVMSRGGSRPSGLSRAQIIANASHAFDASTKSRNKIIGTRKSVVNVALRDAGLSPLTDGEARLLPCDSRGGSVRPGRSRAQVITNARTAFSISTNVVCTEKAFVNQALRDGGLEALTELEARGFNTQ